MTQGIPPLGEQQEREFREAIARTVTAHREEPALAAGLPWAVDLWRCVYGATQEEADAALEEREQHEK